MTMAFEQKDNTGAIFVNDRKEKDTHPDRSGSATIDGVEYWVSGWLKKTKDGQPYLSLAFKPKNGAAAKLKNETATAAGGGSQGFDGEIPFSPEFR
jgi:hypothetical protein